MDELEQKIRDALGEFWDERALPSGPAGETTVDQLLGPLESMTAVDVLATVEGIVEVPIPSSVVQAGGYDSKDEFLDQLTKRVMDHVQKSGK